MDSALDTAIKTALAAEATYNADVATVGNIQAAITTAQAPLAAAQATVDTDKTAFNAALDAVSQAALAAKIP